MWFQHVPPPNTIRRVAESAVAPELFQEKLAHFVASERPFLLLNTCHLGTLDCPGVETDELLGEMGHWC